MTVLLPRPRSAGLKRAATSKGARRAILRALAYSDTFDHAPSANELYTFLEVPGISPATFQHALQELQASGTIILNGELVTLSGREGLATIWRRRQQHSARKWQSARHYTALIRCIPFVRMVAVTGTLAVQSAEAPDDIDLFLIVAPGRVWLARALTILIVRLAARFAVPLCPNYLVAADALELAERNLYTARELVQMQPVYGAVWHHQLRLSNRWTLDYLPNADIAPFATDLPLDHLPAPVRLLKRLGERLLEGRMGEKLEQWEMRRKVRKLLQMRTPAAPEEASFSETACKGHFEGHASRILQHFNERVASLPISEEG